LAEDLTPRDDVRAEIVPDDDPKPLRVPEKTAQPDDAAADAPAEAPPYQSRFQLIFGVLLGVGMAAVAATVLFLAVGKTTSTDEGTATWSSWRPNASDGLEAVSQIATHVGQRYTMPSGNQLVAVNGGALELGGFPVTVALQAQGKVAILNGKGVLYTLCGLGKYCSIKEGKPSVARHLVLRREALELALYTFRYIKNVDEVVVILPPAPGDKPSQAMFFRRSDVGASLDRPLRATLPGSPPNINRLSPESAQGVFLARLTDANLFQYRPEQGGDARVYLVLQPFAG
jgi:hypothetical protein